MVSGLDKVTKTISKKRIGKLGKSASLSALHENSRDAARIRRAAARDDKVLLKEKTRRERDGRLLSRLAFFHAALSSPLPEPIPAGVRGVHALVKLYISRHDAGLAQHEKERRAGRPKTPRHRALEEEKLAEEREYEAGFWTVDVTDEKVAMRFVRDWSGEWGGLGQFSFVRVYKVADEVLQQKEGEGMEVDDDVLGRSVRKSAFPPTAGA